MKKRNAIFSLLLFTVSNSFVPFIEKANAEEYICADVGGVEKVPARLLSGVLWFSS